MGHIRTPRLTVGIDNYTADTPTLVSVVSASSSRSRKCTLMTAVIWQNLRLKMNGLIVHLLKPFDRLHRAQISARSRNQSKDVRAISLCNAGSDSRHSK